MIEQGILQAIFVVFVVFVVFLLIAGLVLIAHVGPHRLLPKGRRLKRKFEMWDMDRRLEIWLAELQLPTLAEKKKAQAVARQLRIALFGGEDV